MSPLQRAHLTNFREARRNETFKSIVCIPATVASLVEAKLGLFSHWKSRTYNIRFFCIPKLVTLLFLKFYKETHLKLWKRKKREDIHNTSNKNELASDGMNNSDANKLWVRSLRPLFGSHTSKLYFQLNEAEKILDQPDRHVSSLPCRDQEFSMYGLHYTDLSLKAPKDNSTH